MTYLYTFLQSNLLEVPFYYAFYRRGLSLREVLLLVTLANLITHPFIFFGICAVGLSLLVSTLLAELIAIGGEPLLHGYGRRAVWSMQPLVASLIANLASWQLAPLLTWLVL